MDQGSASSYPVPPAPSPTQAGPQGVRRGPLLDAALTSIILIIITAILFAVANGKLTIFSTASVGLQLAYTIFLAIAWLALGLGAAICLVFWARDRKTSSPFVMTVSRSHLGAMAVGCASSALGVIMMLCANIVLTVIEVNTIGVDARLFLQIFILLILVWITFTFVRTMQSILLFLKELGESGDYTANSFVPGMTMSESLDATA